MDEAVARLAFLFRASRSARPLLLLGAGASYTSGIPLAADAVRMIARDAYARQVLGSDVERCNPPLSQWWPFLQKQSWFLSGDDRLAENFPLAVDHLLTPRDYRREFLGRMIRPPNGINAGYHFLAQLVQRRLCWTVLTTNFDSLIVDALRARGPHIPEIREINRTEDDLVAFNLHARAQVVYLHGSVAYYRDKNLPNEVQRLDDNLVRALRPLLNTSPLVIIGYRGAEQSIMQHLLGEGREESGNYRHGVYWCALRNERLTDGVRALQEALGTNFFHVEIESFDGLMDRLNAALSDEIHYSGHEHDVPHAPKSISFDQRLAEGATLDDLDQDLVFATMTRYAQRLSLPAPSQTNYVRLLLEQHLLVKQGQDLCPTNGCLLLFGKNVPGRFPYARVTFTRGGKQRKVIEGNLLSQRHQLTELFATPEVNPIIRVKGGRTSREQHAYPERALLEVVVNMLVHRDYETQAFSTIDFQPGELLHLSNPGELLPSLRSRLSVDTGGKFTPVRHATDLRNRSLADIFWAIEAMDKQGTGLTDVHDVMQEYNGRAEFATDDARFRASLFQPLQKNPARSQLARGLGHTERYITNLLPFATMPVAIFILPLSASRAPVLFGPDHRAAALPIFIHHENALHAFADWSDFAEFSASRGDGSRIQRVPLDEYTRSSEGRKRLVWLLAKHFEFTLAQWRANGLTVERDRHRAYFQLVSGSSNRIVYDSAKKKGVAREVVKRREQSRSIWHENEGIFYAVVENDGQWAIQVKPTYVFTAKDGRTPLPAFVQSRRAVQRFKFDRNQAVESDLMFWARFLSKGQPLIGLGNVGVSDLSLSSEYLSVEIPAKGDGT